MSTTPQTDMTVVDKTNKRKWKKPKDKPKRPLSAYNIFFHHERAKILSSSEAPVSLDTQAANRQKRNRTTHGIVSFADLAKAVGERWKSLDSKARAVFEAEAKAEKERYSTELEAWIEMNSMNKSNTKQRKAQTRPRKSLGKKGLPKKSAQKSTPLKSRVKPKSVQQKEKHHVRHLSESVPDYEDYHVHPEMIPKEIFIPNSQKDVHHNSFEASLDGVPPSPSSILFSVPPSTRDPNFDTTAHSECLEVTRRIIEKAKAALTPSLNSTATLPPPVTPRGYKVGSLLSDRHIVHQATLKILESFPVAERNQGNNRKLSSTPDIIDATFWDVEEEKQRA